MKKYENGEYRVDTLVIVGGHLLGKVLVKVVNVEEIDKQRRLFRGDEHPEQPVVVVLAERVLPPKLLADGVERGGVGRGVHDVADGGEREALVRRAAAYLLINCSNTSVALSSADVVAACVSMFSMDGRGGVQTSAEEKKTERKCFTWYARVARACALTVCAVQIELRRDISLEPRFMDSEYRQKLISLLKEYASAARAPLIVRCAGRRSGPATATLATSRASRTPKSSL